MANDAIPYGYCQCGCGEKAPLASKTMTSRGWIKGEPIRFVHGHHPRTKTQLPWSDALYAVEDRGHDTPCWIWLGSKDGAGYGRTRYLKKGAMAHRRSWFQHGLQIPEGCELDHICRVRSCVNPGHLQAVTHVINGQRGLNARLSLQVADEIREKFATGQWTKRGLGRAYGVNERTVLLIIREEIWRH